MNRFTKDNQPLNRGRKPTPPEERMVSMTISVSQEVREWYRRRRGKAGVVLEEYMKKNQE